MFGCTSVYIDEKIVFILREKSDAHARDNGVWFATTAEHHESLKREFPSLRSLELFGPGPTGWQVLPSDSDDFEAAALKACKLVLKGDERIGKIPNRKTPRRSKTKTASTARRPKPKK